MSFVPGQGTGHAFYVQWSRQGSVLEGDGKFGCSTGSRVPAISAALRNDVPTNLGWYSLVFILPLQACWALGPRCLKPFPIDKLQAPAMGVQALQTFLPPASPDSAA